MCYTYIIDLIMSICTNVHTYMCIYTHTCVHAVYVSNTYPCEWLGDRLVTSVVCFSRFSRTSQSHRYRLSFTSENILELTSGDPQSIIVFTHPSPSHHTTTNSSLSYSNQRFLEVIVSTIRNPN